MNNINNSNNNNSNNEVEVSYDDILNQTKRIFDLFDLNKDGFISISELRRVFKSLGHTLELGDYVMCVSSDDPCKML